ncbi:universal stress protein [Actinomadura gamaensis]|uniref:Universal stress protein n=1 Tax=Actinomadura gamaensis TaxID=1763541 RepID=A0ABV9U2A6_9ACTN
MVTAPYVLVGYDGLREGERALRWAVDEARRRRGGLLVCHVWQWPYPDLKAEPEVLDALRDTARQALDRGVEIARELAPRTEVEGRLLEGPVAVELLRESLWAALVVVGANGHDDPPLGGTALRMAARAHRPVIVVREAPAGDGRVVVGFDGSAAGTAALEFGFEEAALQGWRVHVVHGNGAAATVEELAEDRAGGLPGDFAEEPAGKVAGVLAGELAAELAQRNVLGHVGVIEAVEHCRERHPTVAVRTTLLDEPPRRFLPRTAEGAQLLVLGDRTPGGAPPRRIGSTSQAMLQALPCPVALVPAARWTPADVGGHGPPHPGEAFSPG